MDPTTLTASNVSALSSVIGSGDVLYNVYFPSLTLIGVNVTLVNSEVGQLTAINSHVNLVNCNVSTISAVGSTVALNGGVVEGGTVGINAINSKVIVKGTEFMDLGYAFSVSHASLSVEGATYINVGNIATDEASALEQEVASGVSEALSQLISATPQSLTPRPLVTQLPSAPAAVEQPSQPLTALPSSANTAGDALWLALTASAVASASIVLALLRPRRG